MAYRKLPKYCRNLEGKWFRGSFGGQTVLCQVQHVEWHWNTTGMDGNYVSPVDTAKSTATVTYAHDASTGTLPVDELLSIRMTKVGTDNALAKEAMDNMRKMVTLRDQLLNLQADLRWREKMAENYEKVLDSE